LLLFAAEADAAGSGTGGLGNQAVFTSSFLVRFRRGVDNDFAHKVADKYGFDNLGPVSNLRRSLFQLIEQQQQHSSFAVKNQLFYGRTAWARFQPKDTIQQHNSSNNNNREATTIYTRQRSAKLIVTA